MPEISLMRNASGVDQVDAKRRVRHGVIAIVVPTLIDWIEYFYGFFC